MSKTPTEEARESFATYAGMDAPDLPVDDTAALQVLLARWQTRNFGVGNLQQCALGVAEESGELCHAILKNAQGIRGMDDREAFRAAAGDALADICIYAIQCATLLRLDFGTLLHRTAEQVLERDWTVKY